LDETGFYTAGDGTDIWYGTEGSGPPVVLCDGLACDGFIWTYLIDHLVDDYTIVRWHYPAHGLSSQPGELSTLRVERFVRDLEGVLDALEIERAALAGHSLGVEVILEYWDLDPDRVAGLIPICGSYQKPLDTLHHTDALRRAVPYLKQFVDALPRTAQQLWRRAAESKISQILGTLTETNSQLMRVRDFEPYLEHVAQMDVQAFVKLLENIADHSAADILPTIDVPALIIAGEHDTFTPRFLSEEMAESIKKSELIVVPGGTHVSPLEAPDLVNGEIENFLDDLNF
jgi:pimeloyl-ACP methyl ester carboxylesterase